MAEELRLKETITSKRASGRVERSSKVEAFTTMALFMRAPTWMVDTKGTAFSKRLMEASLLENSLTVNCTARALRYLLTELWKKDNI